MGSFTHFNQDGEAIMVDISGKKDTDREAIASGKIFMVPQCYRLVEEDHHFVKEGDKYYRVSKIYHETCDRETGECISRRLLRDNHSEVMYDPAYIPKDLLRE